MAAYAVLFIATIKDFSSILEEFKDDFSCKIDKDKYGYSIYIEASKEDIHRLQLLISEEIPDNPHSK